ncbi:hypothetical protein STEG23_029663, partial [Scotinomys teguina]
FLYTMEYYAAEKNNDIMKFTGKWMELENVILSELFISCVLGQDTRLHFDSSTYVIGSKILKRK